MSETVPGHADLVERLKPAVTIAGATIADVDFLQSVNCLVSSDKLRILCRGMNDAFTALSVLSTPIAAHGAGAVTEALTDKDRIDYWKGAYERMAARNHRLNSALKQIRDQHIPDQPAAYGGTEYDWVVRQYANLRSIATDMVEG